MTIPVLTTEEKRKVKSLKTDFRLYAKHVLKIRDKQGNIVPFILNKAQLYIHNLIEKQRKETGKVRVLLLKGRQQGSSTYVGGRYYHQATTKPGKSVFILSHDGETTNKLFNIVERYNENNTSILSPPTETSNRRRLSFGGDLNSDYYVGTTGNKNVGRGGTIQYFHGSEVAFWENTHDITTGIMESVPNTKDTEIILESTANGLGNMFYEMCMSALSGKSEYQLIFVPWYWQQEYRSFSTGGFDITYEEQEYKDLYGLDLAQIYWRRIKTTNLRGEWRFKQEYPANVTEAFQTSGNGLINPEYIMKARKCIYKDDTYKPIVIGVDPAREGDRTVLVVRQGRTILDCLIYDKMDSMLLSGKTINFIQHYSPKKVFIDRGYGEGTIDRLKELGYGDIVTGVHFGESSSEDIYRNKRTEMFINVRDWIYNEPCNIPDRDDFHSDLAIVPEYKVTSNNIQYIVSKDNIKEIYGKSTDIMDALALTFAYPVYSEERTRNHRITKENQGTLMSIYGG